jgi:hypothetical protein
LAPNSSILGPRGFSPARRTSQMLVAYRGRGLQVVCIMYLLQHEDSDVCAGDRRAYLAASNVPGPDPPRAGLVAEHRQADNRPLKVRTAYLLGIADYVFVRVPHRELDQSDQGSALETPLVKRVLGAQGRGDDEPAYAMFLHGCNDVLHPLCNWPTLRTTSWA